MENYEPVRKAQWGRRSQQDVGHSPPSVSGAPGQESRWEGRPFLLLGNEGQHGT